MVAFQEAELEGQGNWTWSVLEQTPLLVQTRPHLHSVLLVHFDYSWPLSPVSQVGLRRPHVGSEDLVHLSAGL